MNRRTFLKIGSALPGAAAVGGLLAHRVASPGEPGLARIRSHYPGAGTRADGATRIWLPAALSRDTDVLQEPRQRLERDGGRSSTWRSAKHQSPIVSANFPASAPNPTVQLTTRFATRDRMVDLKSPPRTPPREDAAVLKLALQPTELIPTDGIVRDTAVKITKGSAPTSRRRARSTNGSSRTRSATRRCAAAAGATSRACSRPATSAANAAT